MNKMKKVIGILLSLTMVLCFAFAIGCADEEEPVKSISLSESAVTMALFDETTLTVTKTNISGEVEWTTTDNTVLNITETEDGVSLIAIKAGASATITATAGGKSASCTVTVEPTTDTLVLSRSVAGKVILFEEESIDPVTALGMSVKFGGQAFDKADMEYVLTNVEPAGCITVENGTVTAVAEGKATITAKAAYYGNYSNELTIQVESYPEVTVDFLKIDGNDVTLYTAGSNTEVEVKADLVWGNHSISYPTLKSAVSADEEVAIWDSENSKVKAVGVGETTITFTYSFQTTREVVGVLNVKVTENPLYYGQHEKFATNTLVAKMTEGDTLAYEGVNNSNDKDNAFIRFQIIQTEDWNGTSTYYHPTGAKNIFITIQDSANPLNYVTVLLSTLMVDGNADYYSYGAKIGARASVYGAYATDSTEPGFYAIGAPQGNAFAADTTSWAGYNWGIGAFSFYNEYLDATNYEDYYMAISIVDTTVYFLDGGTMKPLIDLANVDGQKAWTGFGNTASLNVYVTTTGFNGAEYSHLVVDTIGGETITSVDGFNIVDNGTSLVPAFQHTHSWATVWTTNAYKHWKECTTVGCLDKNEESDHDYGTGDCICGYHQHNLVAGYDRINHYQKCNLAGCDFIDETTTATHTVENGACTCGYSTIRYGQLAEYAHDGVMADMKNGESLAINGVALPTYTDGLGAEEALMRFQLIPEKVGYNSSNRPYGPQVIYITIADANDSTNSIKLMIVQYATDAPTTHVCVGAKAQDSSAYCGTLGSLTLIGQDTIEGYGSDTNSFSVGGQHLNETDYEKYMMGIVVNGTTVSMQSAGQLLTIYDLEKDNWAGFTSSSVNITISFARYLNNSTIGTLSFDVLGGVALNADSVSNFTIA